MNNPNPKRERHYKLLQSMLHHQVMVEHTPLVEKVSLDDDLYILKLAADTTDEQACNRILKTLPYPRIKISLVQDNIARSQVVYYVPSE